MARGAVRGMVSAWLGLIALQAVSTAGGSGRIASAFTDVNALLQRAIDPSVPAIPDRSGGSGNPSTYSISTDPTTGQTSVGLGPAFGTPIGTGTQTGQTGLPGLPGIPGVSSTPSSSSSRLPWYRQPI